MAEPSRVLLLVGLGPDAGVPLVVRERVDAAVVAARRAGVRVVEASLAGGTPPSTGEVVLPADGRLDDPALAAVTGPGTTSVAIAGAPSHQLLLGLERRLEEIGARLVVLDDACAIGPGGHPAAADTPGAPPDAGGTGSAVEGPGTGPGRPATPGAGDQLPPPTDGGPPAVSVTTEEWAAGLTGRRRSRARGIRFAALAVVLALIVAVVVWSNHEAQGYFTLSPGTAPLLTIDQSCVLRSGGDLSLPDGQPCARVQVPADRAHPLSGSLFMVDVLEGRSTWSDWLLHELGLLRTFRDGSQLFPASSILGSTPPDQLTCENDQEMVQAQTDAPVAALQRLGYDVHEQDLGAQVDLVFPGYPAASAGIACNDVITSVDGQPVRTVQDITRLLAGKAPGTSVAFGVTAPPSHDETTSRTVTAKLVPTPAEDGQPADPEKGFLGVELETRSTYQLPIPVSVQVGDIGGPSAGLALTLAIMDALSGGRLTGGHKVAATGTIAPDGAVGDVGGVAQKAVAVRRAGAQLFLVPPQELAAARSEAGSSLRVVPVTSLSQALAALAAIGGQIPKPPAG